MEDYRNYLKSNHWKKLRTRFYKSKRFKGVCFICDEPIIMQTSILHHKTYKWIGKERLQNLVALCRKCHHEVHFIDNENLPNIKGVLNQRVYQLRSDKRQLLDLKRGSESETRGILAEQR